MKRNSIFTFLLITVSGFAALVLRSSLYAIGTDQRGLLMSFHLLEILLWTLTAAVTVFVCVLVRKVDTLGDAIPGFPARILPAVGCWLLAIAVVLWGDSGCSTTFLIIARVHRLLSFVCAAALLFLGYAHLSEKSLPWVCPAAVSLFFAMHMVLCYQGWSRNPQMQDYVFSLLSCAALAIFAYQQTASAVGMSARRRTAAVGLLSVYLSFAAVPQESCGPVYLAAALWAGTSLYALFVKNEKEN